MSETIRIWKSTGLRFLYRPSALHLQPPSASLSDRVREPNTPLTAASHFSSTRWPISYQEYWQKIQRPCSVIITYFNLDQDFRGSSNPRRLELVHSIIKATFWPREHFAFWPPILHGHDVPDQFACMTCFQKIVELLAPRYILCFGTTAHHLLIEYLPHLGENKIMNAPARLVLLPSLEDMLPDNKLVKKEAWEIIRTLTI